MGSFLLFHRYDCEWTYIQRRKCEHTSKRLTPERNIFGFCSTISVIGHSYPPMQTVLGFFDDSNPILQSRESAKEITLTGDCDSLLEITNKLAIPPTSPNGCDITKWWEAVQVNRNIVCWMCRGKITRRAQDHTISRFGLRSEGICDSCFWSARF